MAQRRMFTQEITDSDAFLEMPVSTQNLYFHLGMKCDDDGFCNKVRNVMTMCKANDDDYKLLIAKRFIIVFESGVMVIKHWRMHNYIQNDRYKETSFLEEKSKLYLKENKSYTLDSTQGVPCIQNVSRLETQVRIDKESKDKTSKDKDNDKERMDEKRTRSEGIVSFEKIIDKHTDKPDLKEAMFEFIKMRQRIKKPLTDRALELLINKLRNMTNNKSEQIEVINQSIERGWQTFYPLKNQDR